MGEWKQSRLGDLTTKIGSGATPRGGGDSYKEEGISLIRSQNILDFRFSPSGLAFIDDSQARELANVAVSKDDVLLNITGDSVARCCKVDQNVLPARVNQHVAIIRGKKDLLSQDFLLYSLIFNKDLLYQLSEIGATRRALTKGMLENFLILSPTLKEQEESSAPLALIDEKIDLLGTQIRTLEAMAALVFWQTFQNPYGNHPLCTLEEFLDVNPYRPLRRGFSSTYLEMSELRTDAFHPDGWFDREFSSGTKFKNGDTLLARITPCLENGKTCFVSFLKDDEVAWGSTEYIVLRSKPMLHSFFSYVLAKNPAFRDFAIGCMSGSSGRQRVEVSHLMGYELNMPSPSEIESFNSAIEPLVQKLNANFEEIRSLTQMRDSLLPKLMSGDVRLDA